MCMCLLKLCRGGEAMHDGELENDLLCTCRRVESGPAGSVDGTCWSTCRPCALC